MSTSIPTRLSGTELVAEVLRLVHSARATTASQVAHLAELDARRLDLGAGLLVALHVLHGRPGGRRCAERGFLERHHVEPHAVGGEATVDNIQLRCRAHNAYEAELFYGLDKVVRGDGVRQGRERG